MSKKTKLKGVSKRGRKYVALAPLTPAQKKEAEIQADATAAIAHKIFQDYALIVFRELARLKSPPDLLPEPQSMIDAFDTDVNPLEFAKRFYDERAGEPMP